MCFTSLVMQQFDPYIPQQWPQVQPHAQRVYTEDEVKELLDAFRKAYEAAEKFDFLTGQADCVDPEKAKLLERIEELERKVHRLDEGI